MITDIVELKRTLKTKIEKKYGSIKNFLNAKEGKGYKNLYQYLSPHGPVSYKTLSKLCKQLKVGKLSKEVKIVRKVIYTLEN